MKKKLLLTLFFVGFSLFSVTQVKVLPQNKVVVGCSTCTSQVEEFAVKGNSYFIESPSQSGLSIRNENWNNSFNLMGIIPQWNSSTLLGTDNNRFLKYIPTTFILMVCILQVMKN